MCVCVCGGSGGGKSSVPNPEFFSVLLEGVVLLCLQWNFCQMFYNNSAVSYNMVVPLVFASLFHAVEFSMYTLYPLLLHDAKPNPPPLPDTGPCGPPKGGVLV